MLSPTFPFALFAKGFFVESQFDIPKCVALKKGKNDEIKEVSFNNFVQTLCSWFNGEYLTDPIGKSEISTIRPVDI
jgi:hypothetical protein